MGRLDFNHFESQLDSPSFNQRFPSLKPADYTVNLAFPKENSVAGCGTDNTPGVVVDWN
jgi:hypothetical protein